MVPVELISLIPIEAYIPSFHFFFFFLIHSGQFLSHIGASFHPIKALPSISVLSFLSLLWHVWANRNFPPALHSISVFLWFAGCCLVVHLYRQRRSMTDVTSAQLEDLSRNQDIWGNECWSPKVTSSWSHHQWQQRKLRKIEVRVKRIQPEFVYSFLIHSVNIHWAPTLCIRHSSCPLGIYSLMR